MGDKRCSLDDVVAELSDGMTVGIGGWGSRRKPMALVRAILRSGLRDLTVVSYGGPDVGLLCASGQARKVVYGFVSLDSIPLEPHFRAARQAGSIEAVEYDEGMLQWALYAAALRLPFLPTRAGIASDVMAVNPGLRTVRSPYDDAEEFVAVPALHLDVALLHANVADPAGNAMLSGPDPFFDDLYAGAAARTFVTAERVVPQGSLTDHGPVQCIRVPRHLVTGVTEAPRGAHFTSCPPDYGRDEAFQRSYAAAAGDPEKWREFSSTYLEVGEPDYQRLTGGGA